MERITGERYQDTWGISLLTSLTRVGTTISDDICLPAIPPTALNGNATNNKRAATTSIVPTGSAVVELLLTATVLRNINTKNKHEA